MNTKRNVLIPGVLAVVFFVSGVFSVLLFRPDRYEKEPSGQTEAEVLPDISLPDGTNSAISETGGIAIGERVRTKQSAHKKFLTNRERQRKKRTERTKVQRAERSEADRLKINEGLAVCSVMTECLDEDRLDDALIEARRLLNHTNEIVRLQVCMALDWIGTNAIYELAGLIDDSNPEIRQMARDSFWAQMDLLTPDSSKVAFLQSVASEADPDTAECVAEQLSQCDPSVGFNALLELWDNSSGDTRESIQYELGAMTGEEFETLDEWRAWYNEFDKNKHSDSGD
jgi:hypothetical protein